MSPLAPCARCHTPLEDGDLRCAICGQSAPTHARGPERTTLAILRCQTCGAAVTYSAEHQGARCGFCASVMQLEQPVDPVESPQIFLPFHVDPQTAHGALRAWLRSLGWFRPGDLATGASLAALRPIFWAAWIFDATALVSWAADSNAGSRRSAWAPHAGQTPMRFQSVLVSASRGLAADECARLAPSFDLRTALPEPRGPQGALLERFDVQRSAARFIIAQAIQGTAVHQLTHGWIPGSSFRNVHVAVLLQGLHTQRAALPSYVLAYRYDGKLYRAIVHGQDARSVFGQAPYSVWKIAFVIAAGIAAVILLVGIVAGALAASR